jgi:DNA uptake protein ComE-like DNA-binding protein
MNLHSATTEQLKTLPGFTDALAQKIVQGRPYRVKADLVRKNVIPQDAYDKIASEADSLSPALYIARAPRMTRSVKPLR